MPSRRLFLAPLLAVLVLALGACHQVKKLVPPNFRPPEDSSTALDQAKATLQQATPCCSSYADFSYQNLLPWEPKRFELGPGSLVASINGERSYFLSFRLPPDSKLPYRIALKSELNGRWLRASYLFGPTVTMLDEAFQPISSEDIPLCEHMGWTSEIPPTSRSPSHTSTLCACPISCSWIYASAIAGTIHVPSWPERGAAQASTVARNA